MRRIVTAVMALVCASGFASPACAAYVENPAPEVHASHGITVTNTDTIDDRQVEYTIQTDTLDEPVRIRVVMPSNFRAGKRYPVLYLYHGTSGSPANWPDS